MIFVRHSEGCAGKPVAGRLTGTCDCKTAKLDEAARARMEQMLDELEDASIDADEDSEYFALRLDALVEHFEQAARRVRRTAKRADRDARRASRAKRQAS